MKKLIHAWKSGVIGLLTNKTISFYTFFTIIFAECIYLWIFKNIFIAFPATIFLLGYVANVMIFSWIKGNFEGTIEEFVTSILYIITYIMLFILLLIFGNFFYYDGGIILTLIPFAVTSISVTIRRIQRIFYKFIFAYIILQLVVIAGPIIALIAMIIKITIIPAIVKIIISILYIFWIPFMAYQEAMTGCNIFEIAFNIKWLKRNNKMKDYRTVKINLLKD